MSIGANIKAILLAGLLGLPLGACATVSLEDVELATSADADRLTESQHAVRKAARALEVACVEMGVNAAEAEDGALSILLFGADSEETVDPTWAYLSEKSVDGEPLAKTVANDVATVVGYVRDVNAAANSLAEAGATDASTLTLDVMSVELAMTSARRAQTRFSGVAEFLDADAPGYADLIGALAALDDAIATMSDRADALDAVRRAPLIG